jgi:hypothetical protein
MSPRLPLFNSSDVSGELNEEVNAEASSSASLVTSQLFPVVSALSQGDHDGASVDSSRCVLPSPFAQMNDASSDGSGDHLSNSDRGSSALLLTPSKKTPLSKTLQSLMDNKDLTAKILQAVADTAETAATMQQGLEFAHRSKVFMICSRPKELTESMADDLIALLAAKPELALCRAVNMGLKASDGWTPLHCAAQYGNMRAISILLQQEDVTAWECDLLGRLPLHIAASKSNADACTVLMEAMQMQKETGEGRAYSTPPSASPSLMGAAAPVDAAGTTPLGSATRDGKGKPSSMMRELLYQPRDTSVFACSPFVARSGRTPLKRPNTSLRLRPVAKSTAKTVHEEEVFDMDLSYAHSEAQGWRGEMEDQTILQCPMRREKSQREMKWCMFGVLDGMYVCSNVCNVVNRAFIL